MHLHLCPGVVRWDGISSEGFGEAFHLRVCNLASLLFLQTSPCSLEELPIHRRPSVDSCREYADPSHLVVSREISTPLDWRTWSAKLSDHPDKRFSSYILSGIREGFRIGFIRFQPLSQTYGNLHCPSLTLVSNYLSREVELGRMWQLPVGVFPRGIHVSPIGLIPKKNRPGKWRLIVDFSSPTGKSINDGIRTDWSSLLYTSVDHLAALIVAEGRGAYLVKAGIKEAYRMVPIHPEDQHLLAVRWRGKVFIDKCLPFGLRSAPKIFTAVADALQWILKHEGTVVNSLHYLDDFILVAPSSSSAESQKQAMLSLFDSLGVPIEPTKLEGPSSSLQFLGIEVDTQSLQLRLPSDKLSQLRTCLQCCAFHRSVRKHALEKLTGLLQFATKVVRPGRPFLRRLYALQNIGIHPDHLVRLNNPAIADITWWLLFTERWNGISLLWDLGLAKADTTVFSDASGSWGCGAVQDNCWLQLRWSPRLSHFSIAMKEMILVVLAAAVFGPNWSGKVVQFVDNEAVVSVLNSTNSKDTHLMHLVRLLVFFAAKFDFWFTAAHILGRLNILADAISRNHLDQFFRAVPAASHNPTLVPPAVVELLSLNTTWISASWTHLFREATSN